MVGDAPVVGAPLRRLPQRQRCRRPRHPQRLLPARKPRAVPFIYSQQDIDALLAACDTEFADERIAATLRTAIGLLAATGLRIGEALNLRVPDIDQHNDLLMIKAAKSHERLVPVHPSTTAALMQYIALPARMATRPDPHGPVFVTGKGTGYVYVSFQCLFKRVREAAGLAPRAGARPRPHDYADLRVMPTSARSSLWRRESRLMRSA
jgi:integrase